MPWSHPEEGNLEVSKQAMEEAVPRLQYHQEIPQEVWQLKVLGPDALILTILTHTKTEMEGLYLDVFGSFEAREPRRKKQTSDRCGRHVVLDLRRVRMRSPIRSSDCTGSRRRDESAGCFCCYRLHPYLWIVGPGGG